MAESRDDEGVFLVDPEFRCILPLDKFHVARRLGRTLRSGAFTFTIDRAFAAVIDGCAAPGPDREDTWINPDIRALYMELHRRGTAHSVETRIDGELIGGLYGVALGGAFFGESMFSWATDASKAALVQLAARLRRYLPVRQHSRPPAVRRTPCASVVGAWPFTQTRCKSTVNHGEVSEVRKPLFILVVFLFRTAAPGPLRRQSNIA